MSFKIVSDSSSDIITLGVKPDVVGFASVPLKISTAEREFVDTPGLDTDEMLAYLAGYKGKSGSSCPNQSDFESAFEGADNIFCVTITSGLSGSYNSACAAAREYLSSHPQSKIHVIDTLSVGPEAALITEKLCDLILQGLDFDKIVEKISEYQKKTHLLFALRSLHNLACNGRVSPIAAKVAGVLDLRVVGKASEKGTLELLKKPRGEKKMLAAIIETMKENGYAGGKVRLHYCQSEAVTAKLKEMLLEQFPSADILTRETRGLCSFYAESGGMLIGYES